MVSFIVGLLVGCFIGVLVMCLCRVASESDKYITDIEEDRDKKMEDDHVDWTNGKQGLCR